jgi:hypothetical protein
MKTKDQFVSATVHTVIMQCLSSPLPKCRMLATSYLRLLFGWSAFSVQCVFQLLGDTDVIVSTAAVEELEDLQECLSLLPNDLETDKNLAVSASTFDAEEIENPEPSLKTFSTEQWSTAFATVLSGLQLLFESKVSDYADVRTYGAQLVQAVKCAVSGLQLVNDCLPISYQLDCYNEAQTNKTNKMVHDGYVSRLLEGADFISLIRSISKLRTHPSTALKKHVVRLASLLLSVVRFISQYQVADTLINASREQLLPVMLWWLSDHQLALDSYSVVGEGIGILCSWTVERGTASGHMEPEIDFLCQTIRILKLKAKEHGELKSSHIVSGTPLLALAAVANQLARHIADSDISRFGLAEVSQRLITDLLALLIRSLKEEEVDTAAHKRKLIPVLVTGHLLSSLGQKGQVQFPAAPGLDSLKKRKLDGTSTLSPAEVGETDYVSDLSSSCQDLKEILLSMVRFGAVAAEQSRQLTDDKEQTTYAAVRAVAEAALWGNDSDFRCSAATKLFSRELWAQSLTVTGRFCIAESLFKLLMQMPRKEVGKISLLSVMEDCCLNGSRNVKASCVVFLLVIAKNGAVNKFCVDSQVSSSVAEPPGPSILLFVCQLLLTCLQENDVFIQDVSCLALYHLFAEALQHDRTSSSEGDLSISEKVANEVIYTLTRDKRRLAPGGVALAGETVGTSVQGDIARALATAAGERSSSTNDNSAAPRELPSRDELLSAAATAAAQLGMTPHEIAEASSRIAAGGHQARMARQAATDAGIFGIYSAACKVARKSGDAAFVFFVLASIQRDPSFSVASNVASQNPYAVYAPASIRVSTDKVKLILPMLYMFQFEMNVVIRDVMRALWQMLIVKPRREYLSRVLQSEIVAYLIVHMNSKSWRERYSAASALEQLHTSQMSHSWATMRQHIDQIWDAGFYMLDDVKDENRAAALQLMKCVAESALRCCDSTLGSQYSSADAVEVVEFLVPKILQKGLLSPCVEGKGFALGVLNQVIKSARSLLGSHRPSLLSVLIECMSAFEPQMLQYMQFHTSRLSISDEELERIRVRLATESPMQEALDICLQSLDQQCVSESLRVITGQLAFGVGLATRVAALKSIAFIGGMLWINTLNC